MQTPTPEIRQALYAHLIAALPIGEIGLEDIAWPNVKFEARINRMYLAPTCMYGESDLAALSNKGFELLKGIFQISVYGILHSGEAAMENVSRTLVDVFRAGTRLSVECGNDLQIVRCYRSTMMIDPGGEIARPRITISADWINYAQRGE